MKKLIPVYILLFSVYALLVVYHQHMAVRIIVGLTLYHGGRWAESIYPIYSGPQKPGSGE